MDFIFRVMAIGAGSAVFVLPGMAVVVKNDRGQLFLILQRGGIQDDIPGGVLSAFLLGRRHLGCKCQGDAGTGYRGDKP